MPVLTYQESRQKLASGELPRILLIHGDEEFLERELLKLLKSSLERQDSLDCLEWDEGSSEEDRYTSLTTMPFGATKRLVVISDPTAALSKGYLQVVNPALVLVLLYHSRVRQNELVYKKASLQGWVVACTPLRGRELIVRLQDEARLRHKLLPAPAVEYLHFLCGDNLAQLCQEIEKAALYLGRSAKEITVPVLKEIGSRTIMRSVFELVDAVGEQRREQVKGILTELVLQGESPVLLTALLSRHFLQLLEVASLLEEGVVPQRVAEVMQIHPYVAKKMLCQVAAIPTPEVERNLSLLLELDHQIKQGKGAPELLLEASLCEICMKKPLARHSKR